MTRRVDLRAVLGRAAFFAILWVVLAGARVDSVVVGSASVVGATLTSLWLSPPAATRVSPAGVLRFLAFFLVHSVHAGVQVAALALRPRLALQPGLHEITLRLPEGPGRVLLANTLSLLPGTLAVGLDGARLRLHVLDVRAPTEAEVRRTETRIADMLGLDLEAT